MTWQERRYNFLLFMRELLEDGENPLSPAIEGLLQRISLISSEEEFNRYIAHSAQCSRESFEKMAKFEAV